MARSSGLYRVRISTHASWIIDDNVVSTPDCKHMHIQITGAGTQTRLSDPGIQFQQSISGRRCSQRKEKDPACADGGVLVVAKTILGHACSKSGCCQRYMHALFHLLHEILAFVFRDENGAIFPCNTLPGWNEPQVTHTRDAKFIKGVCWHN